MVVGETDLLGWSAYLLPSQLKYVPWFNRFCNIHTLFWLDVITSNNTEDRVSNCPPFLFLGEELSGEHMFDEQLSGKQLSGEQLPVHHALDNNSSDISET